MPKLKKKVDSGLLAQGSPFKSRRAVAVVGLVVVVGVAAILFAFAAGPFASVEPEDGALSGGATALNVSGASGGKVVRFGSGATPTPTPTPAPSSSPSSCALPNYPNASCTGVPAGTVLSAYTGPTTITVANTIIDSKTINGCIAVQAPGVIIRKSSISCTNGWAAIVSVVGSYSGARLLVEDTEITCGGTKGTGMADWNFTARRVNIHDCENGFDMDTDITLEDSYIHDLICYNPSTDPHVDGIQSPIGSRLLINHNTIYASRAASSCSSGNNIGNASININNSGGGPTSTDTTISNNLLAGGGYTLYCPIPGTSNFRITNNRFSTIFHDPKVGLYGPSTDCGSNEIKSGNVYHESGQAVTLD